MTALGHLLPAYVHELNNSLQVVSGLVEMLSARDHPPDVRSKLERIAAQTSRSTRLFQSLSAFARAEAAPGSMADVERIAVEALEMRQFQFSRREVRTSTATRGSAPFLVATTPVELLQAALNLIVNAELAVHDRPSPEIGLEIQGGEDLVTLVVRDNGRGLSHDVARRAAEPFFTTRPGAAGLGLTVVELVAARCGGSLQLEPQAPAGCEARLALPRARSRS